MHANTQMHSHTHAHVVRRTKEKNYAVYEDRKLSGEEDGLFIDCGQKSPF